MGNGMNKVLPGLYVGNYRDSKDQQQLDKYQISHIIAIHDSPRRLLPDKHYLCVMAADTPDQNLSQYFSVCNDFIHAARLRDGNVLIHCLAGMSRSVTVAVAYIMTATNLSWKDALKVVRAGRAVANPNDGFQNQLQEFEMYRLAEERRRLRERFPSSALEQHDRTKCSMALDNYEELLQNRNICEGNCSRGEKCPTGVCNMDPTKGLFRRRPSSSSTRSRLRPSASTAGLAATAKSCPTSPKHAPGQRLSIGEQKIPEDEEAYMYPSTSSSASASAGCSLKANNSTPQPLQQQQQLQQHHHHHQQQQQQYHHKQIQPTVSNPKSSNGQQKQHHQHHQQQRQHHTNARAGSVGSRDATGPSAGSDKHSNGSNLQRSASTVSGLGIRPRSSPAGLHSYTGSVPSSVHGSRVDLDNIDKGSAIYLGCSAPKNSSSMWSLASRGSIFGSSAPPTPVHTPPVSPRHDVKRTPGIVVKRPR